MSVPRVDCRESRLERTSGPVALYRELTDRRERAGTALLEFASGAASAPERSYIFHDPAVRIVGRGNRVRLSPCNETGRMALSALRPELRGCGELSVEQRERVVEVPSAAPSGADAERLRECSQLDVLRVMSFEWRGGGGDAERRLRLPGYFAYDCADAFERSEERSDECREGPDFVFWLPRSMVDVDHISGETRVLQFGYGGAGASNSEEAESVFGRTRAVIDGLSEGSISRDGGGEPEGPSPVLEADLSDAAYARLVESCREEIRRGEVFQIVPSRSFRLEPVEPLPAYARLRRQNPSPYMFYLQRGAETVFGASPETALRVDPSDRRVELRPIAGTRGRSRGESGTVDRYDETRREVDLRTDPKELAEHAMLVDLARNDLSRVSRAGTVEVERLMRLERYSDVMHLVSRVRGELESDLDALHAYRATMNAGTLVGAPKPRAAELLREIEPSRRGPYGGAIGCLRADGALDTGIIIRTAVVDSGGEAEVRVGAGIVQDSDPEAEAAETRAKARAVVRAIRDRPGVDDFDSVASPPDVDVLLVDNRDSFVFLLAEALRRRGADVEVHRSDRSAEALVAAAERLEPPRLVILSPGPGFPSEAGCSPALAQTLWGRVPLFGVCLGYQVLIEAAGGRVRRAEEPVHGESAEVLHRETPLFDGLRSPLRAGRYHSLVAETVPAQLEVTARLESDPEIPMACEHRIHPVAGLQFHPESILTSRGEAIVDNILDWARAHDLESQENGAGGETIACDPDDPRRRR